MIFAIDPGTTESAFVVVKDDLSEVVNKGKVTNQELIDIINEFVIEYTISGFNVFGEDESLNVAIEMVASYGMAVGKEVFETCVWIGRFYQTFYKRVLEPTFIYRKDEKMCLCNSMKAKDSNIRQALIDRFGVVGTKKNPGYFYGFKKDIWAAMAVAVTYHDMYME